MKLEVKDIMAMIDHTNLKQGITVADLKKLCDEAIKFGFCSVCVHPSNVAICKEFVKNSKVKVCAVVGFPLGENQPELKALEAKMAHENGADEIDMVISNSMVKRGDYDGLLKDVNGVQASCPTCVHKVIIETCLLTKEEIVKVSETLLKSNCDFVKTSTGFCGAGATPENVALIKSIVKDNKLIKAAGGISGAKDAIAMIEAGASRLGTSKGGLIADQLINGVTAQADDKKGY
ncbi:MAG: deoxyribose-phosphate aldolase [Clostridia bacterium]